MVKFLLLVLVGCTMSNHSRVDEELIIEIEILKKEKQFFLSISLTNIGSRDLLIPELIDPLYNCKVFTSEGNQLDNFEILDSFIFDMEGDSFSQRNISDMALVKQNAINELRKRFIAVNGSIDYKKELFINEAIVSWVGRALFLRAGESLEVVYKFDEWLNKGGTRLEFGWEISDKFKIYFPDDLKYQLEIVEPIIGFELIRDNLRSELHF
jgi:hypothetical protein